MALDKVIVALDYNDPEAAIRLIDAVSDKIQTFKIGATLFASGGTEVIRYLHRKNKAIFLDLKLHDTPAVVADAVHQFAELGVDFATVHCLGGRKMLEAASRGCRQSRLHLIGVTLLTSVSSSDLSSMGLVENGADMIHRLVDLAVETRLAGVLCSAHELKTIRPRVLPGFLLVTAGIRPPKMEVFQDDQERIATPTDALAWGSDYLIIGRPITQAREPRRAVQTLFSPTAV